MPIPRARRPGGEGQDAVSCALAGSGAAQRPGAVSEDLKAMLKPRARKYGNRPVEIDGLRFDSGKEGARYVELSAAQRAGEINGLDVHTRFPLVVHGQDCGYYEADFTYRTASGEQVIEDVKSDATRKLPAYRLKAKLIWAMYGLRIREV